MDMRLFRIAIKFSCIVAVLFFTVIPQPARAGNLKSYVFWWPLRATPWAYQGKTLGGAQFQNYVSSRDFAKLKNDFDSMIKLHKPSLVLYMSDWRDWMPMKNFTVLPESNNTIEQIAQREISFEYADDIVRIAKANGIEVVMYPIVSGYGGQLAYPFDYYSKTGWFWKRPDWPNGLADPTTDAMRHPTSAQNGSIYDWCEHEAAYVKVDCTAKHFPLTTNGIEETGLGTWKVFESPDMVYNGYDTVLHNNTLHLHTPIPSLSSQAYRDLTKEVFRKIGAHFRGKGVSAYFLFQEPTYAHLRENVNYCNNNDNGTGAGNTCRYEVDYSAAEKNRYNQWRQSKGMAPVDKVPYPVDSAYQQFKEFNLADFLANLKAGLKEGDPNAQALLSIFAPDNQNIRGMGVNPATLLSTVKPDWVTYEPPQSSMLTTENLSSLQALITKFTTYSTAKKYVSYYNGSISVDSVASSKFFSNGFTDYYAPATVDSPAQDPAGYATWAPNGCTGCTFRYKVPGVPVANIPSTTVTPTATNVPTATAMPTASCVKKSLGDSNCDGLINLNDFERFRQEYTGILSSKSSDFNNDGKITLIDFETWRRNFN